MRVFLFKDQVTHLEKQVNERVEELNSIKSDLRRNEVLVTQQAETIQKILDERDCLNDLIQQLTKEKVDLFFLFDYYFTLITVFVE